MSLKDFQARHAKISQQADIHIEDAESIARESLRVAEVAGNADAILSDLDHQFELCTGLNALDVSILAIDITIHR